MKVGLLLNPQTPDGGKPADVWRENLALAELAEDVGFSSVHLPEHHGRSDDHLPQPLVALAAIAGRTRTIKVGTSVLLAPLRHPLHLIEEANVLDVVSGGRVILGLGLGNHAPEFASFGLSTSDQGDRFDETLEILTQAWSSGIVNYKGKYFSLNHVSIRPRPVQSPHPELWIGATSVRGARRAGKFGASLLLDPINSIEQLVPLVDAYRVSAEESGYAAKTILMRWACVDADLERIERQWWPQMEPLVSMYTEEIPRYDASVRTTDAGASLFATFSPDRLLVGGSSDIIEMASKWTMRLGADYLVVKLQGPGGPWGSSALEVVSEFGAKVVSDLASV